jgi:hypothetical protein
MDLVVSASLSARPTDRVLERGDVAPVSVVDPTTATVRPVAGFSDVGDLGVSNLAVLPDDRVVVATQALVGIVDHGRLGWWPPHPGLDLEDVHEVVVAAGIVLVADAALDAAIVVSSDDLAPIEVIRPPEPGTYHLNQALPVDGRILGIVHDVRGRSRRTAAGLVRHGDGGVIDLRTGEILLRGCRAPHSLRTIGDHWLLLDSGNRRLLVFDDHWTLQDSIELPGWGRGAVHDRATDTLWVGISPPRPRYQRALGWDVPRRPSVVAVHLPSSSIRARIELEAAEQVNDVCLVAAGALDLTEPGTASRG